MYVGEGVDMKFAAFDIVMQVWFSSREWRLCFVEVQGLKPIVSYLLHHLWFEILNSGYKKQRSGSWAVQKIWNVKLRCRKG